MYRVKLAVHGQQIQKEVIGGFQLTQAFDEVVLRTAPSGEAFVQQVEEYQGRAREIGCAAIRELAGCEPRLLQFRLVMTKECDLFRFSAIRDPEIGGGEVADWTAAIVDCDDAQLEQFRRDRLA